MKRSNGGVNYLFCLMLPYHFLCDLLALDGFTFFDLHHNPFLCSSDAY
jgi:hypothetical protein